MCRGEVCALRMEGRFWCVHRGQSLLRSTKSLIVLHSVWHRFDPTTLVSTLGMVDSTVQETGLEEPPTRVKAEMSS
jgi:hypothetical protein